jgi:hypothetical protein
MQDIPKTIIGACGEHYVAALLSGLGLIVALPRGGVPTADLVVSDTYCESSVAVQVKTGTNPWNPNRKDPQGSYFAWETGAKVIGRVSPSFWYAFVSLNGWPESERSPQVFFVPSQEVSSVVRSEQLEGHKRLFFWMYAENAKACTGSLGAQRLIEQLRRKP